MLIDPDKAGKTFVKIFAIEIVVLALIYILLKIL